jgi:hypothetical protein
MPTTDLSGTCTSAEDGRLLKVSEVAKALKDLKPGEPDKVLVAAIAGPTSPYVVRLGAPTLTDDPSQWPSIDHSCTQGTGADQTYADPAIRIREWIEAFGGNGVFQSICNDSFRPALMRIAEEIGRRLGNPCVEGQILNTMGALWNGQADQEPECNVVDHQKNDQGTVINTPLPHCAGNNPTGATACWALEAGGAGCATGHTMKFNRPAAITTELNSSVACSVRVEPR